MSSRLTILAVLAAAALSGREAKLLRYPSYHQGRVAFSYMGDVWTADETGKNIQRLTVHTGRDINPRFSPDGKWIAFSSERQGNLDVFVVAAGGGPAKQLTFHSADDTVLGWTPDSKAVLFTANRGEDFLVRLYTVSLDGAERPAGPDIGLAGSYSPDGTKLAINRKGQVYWRKYYRGSYQTDVTVMDLKTKKFTDVTDWDGLDSWPMWGRDGNIYFVSDRDGNGLTNLWRVKESGGKAEKVSSFTSGDVRYPSISADGKVIVFEHDFGLWKFDTGSKKATELHFDIEAELQENLSEVRTVTRAEEFSLAPNAKRVAVVARGEIFTAPVDEGDLRQITDNPARDRDVVYSPDGKTLAFVSDRSGREEIWLEPADGGDAKRLTDLDTLKSGLRWSPDSKELLFATSDNKLLKAAVADGKLTEVASSKYGTPGQAAWSPDLKWIAYSKSDAGRTSDVYLVPSTGGTERKVTFDSASDTNPKFSSDGKKLYFVRGDGFSGGEGAATRQLYVAPLEKLDKDPEDAEESPAEPETPAGPGARRPAAAAPVKEVAIDWDGLKHRTRAVTRLSGSVMSYDVVPDGKTLVFVTMEGGAGRGTPALYSIQDTGKRQTRIAAGGAPEGAAAGGPGGRGGFGFGGGFGGLTVSKDGRSVFFLENGAVSSVTLPAGGGSGAAMGGGAGPAAAGAGAARKRVAFTAKIRISKTAEWAEMFGDAWRTMKYRFYDAKMHGRDWDALRAKYQPLVEFVGERQELLNLINEMIGELNASHTGAAPGPGNREGAIQSVSLGLELTADEAAGRYKVSHVYEEGPADKDWVKVKVGDYLIAIDGKPVTATDNYWKWLNNERLNKKVVVTLNAKPAEDGAWTARIEPVSAQAFSQLRYERWVKERREMVTKLSGGKVGYVHIQAMDQPSLRRFEKELREFREKPALIIDQRFNGGGNIEQELLAILVQREYQLWQPRGTETTGRPFAGYFGKKIVLQNWRSASNAEMFPAGFRALGLGKTLGTPTMGAVIGTGSYSLIDGSTVRTPGVGVYLADAKRTNLENLGVKPDILVENPPEEILAGKDRQIEAAVAELLKELK